MDARDSTRVTGASEPAVSSSVGSPSLGGQELQPRREFDVTLVVVTHNSEPLLPDFCEVLPAALAGLDRSRVVVVDSGSSDATTSLARHRVEVDDVLQLPANLGYAAGINAGIEAAPARAYLVLNPDVQLGAGSVRKLFDAIQVESGIVVPRLLDEDGVLLLSLRRRPSLLRAAGEALLGGRAGMVPPFGETVRSKGAYRRRTRADWATGGAMLVSDECARETGAWDESFFLYEEEVDYALRAQHSGFGLRLVPEATAVRMIGDDPPGDFVWALSRVNKVRLYGRSHSRVAAGAFTAMLLLGELLRIPRGESRRKRAIIALLWPMSLLDEVLQRMRQRPAKEWCDDG